MEVSQPPLLRVRLAVAILGVLKLLYIPIIIYMYITIDTRTEGIGNANTLGRHHACLGHTYLEKWHLFSGPSFIFVGGSNIASSTSNCYVCFCCINEKSYASIYCSYFAIYSHLKLLRIYHTGKKFFVYFLLKVYDTL